ncbi:putative casparian strip membrane protein [Helianthus annuus]|nr:putative casparian strip membrane protein [Helianthus annuus]
MSTENNNSGILKIRPVPSPVTHLSFMLSQVSLRLAAAAASIAAACLMLNSRQSKVLFGTNLDARYTYSPAFKFFTMMNVVACAFSVLSLLPVFVLSRKLSNSLNYFFLFLHDLMIVILLAGGFGAATTYAQVGKYGNSHAGWMPICNDFGKFCHHVAASLILGFLALFCYMVLAVMSANKARQIKV